MGQKINPRKPGLEPGSTVWETAILPLDHLRVSGYPGPIRGLIVECAWPCKSFEEVKIDVLL